MIHKKLIVLTIMSLKPFFNINFLFYYFFSYIKMPKNPSAKYYQKKNKERLQKKACER